VVFVLEYPSIITWIFRKKADMTRTAELSARRSEIIEEMGRIHAMRKGTLNATWKDVAHKDGEVVRKGPYYVLTNKAPGGKTQTLSVAPQDAERVQAEVDNYKRFRQLADEYVDVCDEMSVLSCPQPQGDAKKN
jgi:hypothetical protein